MSEFHDQFAIDHLLGCIKAFLKGKKNLNWVMSFIKGNNLPPEDLQKLITPLQGTAVPGRYKELITACQEEKKL